MLGTDTHPVRHRSHAAHRTESANTELRCGVLHRVTDGMAHRDERIAPGIPRGVVRCRVQSNSIAMSLPCGVTWQVSR